MNERRLGAREGRPIYTENYITNFTPSIFGDDLHFVLVFSTKSSQKCREKSVNFFASVSSGTLQSKELFFFFLLCNGLADKTEYCSTSPAACDGLADRFKIPTEAP